MRAALLARGGFTSARSALEGKVGLLALIAERYDLSKIDRFGEPWGILEPTFGRGINLKPHPVCASGVGAVEGMQALMARHEFGPDEVERIECGVRPHALNILMHHQPKTGLEAKFSLPYALAAAVLDDYPGFDSFTDTAAARPEARKLVSAVEVERTPGGTGLLDGDVALEVELADGSTLHARLDLPPGAPLRAPTDEELRGKFAACGHDVPALPADLSWPRAAELLRAAFPPRG